MIEANIRKKNTNKTRKKNKQRNEEEMNNEQIARANIWMKNEQKQKLSQNK